MGADHSAREAARTVGSGVGAARTVGSGVGAAPPTQKKAPRKALSQK